MYAKFLLKESFLVELSSLLEGMKMVLSSSLKLFKLMYEPFAGRLYSLMRWPVLVRRDSPDKQANVVELPASRWCGHYQHPPSQLYLK